MPTRKRLISSVRGLRKMNDPLEGSGQAAQEILDIFGIKQSMVTKLKFELEACKMATITVEYLVPEEITRNFKELMQKYKLVEITDEQS